MVVGGSQGVHLGRAAGNISVYGAHLRDYLPDPLNHVAGSAARDVGYSAKRFLGSENSLYPGLLTFFLAVASVCLLARRKLGPRAFAGWALTAVVLVGVLFAAPSPMRLLGRDVSMPSSLVLKVLPAFRVPSRLSAMIMVAVVPLAAFALARLLGWARGHGGSLMAIAVGATAIGVSVAELAIVPMPMANLSTPPPVYAAVAKTPPGVLAEYPLRNSSIKDNSAYVFWQQSHGRPLVTGADQYSPADAMRRMLVDPRAPGTASSLALLGVTAIITRSTTYDWNEFSKIPDTANYGHGYSLVGTFPGDVRVWRVTARPAPAIAVYRLAYVGDPSDPDEDGFVGYPI